ncbi:unnamed protein product [Didymodactylos carnosus]|uniref:Tripeptidyl-peptidase 1 n=1 Tax=Didymodactylos carnosus TaxID=1234261 RepID=A0A8S2I4U7_9BILA|nr:unnamed protein product [Didymodactylos carnosus]CAF3711601.1 unnamed protein product [Didymodactylos carnosus]
MVKHASKLFSTKFYPYTHVQNTKRKIHRISGQYQIPDEIYSCVDLTVGLDTFPIERNIFDRQQKFTDDNVDSLQQQLKSVDVIIPELVIDYYKIPNVKKTGLPRNDVSQSSIQYRPLSSKHILGVRNNQSNPDLEAFLDVEQMSGINPLAENWFINYESGVNPDGSGENFYTTILTLNQLDHLPQVLSISYGDPEIGLCKGFTGDCNTTFNSNEIYIRRTNIEFMKLSMRGISILVSSGDSGANGFFETNCTNKIFYPEYPTACPYLTSVGATQLIDIEYNNSEKLPRACSVIIPPVGNRNATLAHCISNGTEVAVDTGYTGYTSGGGFSSYTSQPLYQKRAVNKYFKLMKCQPPTSMYNRRNRGFPDVSAFGTHGFFVFNGTYHTFGGTSMSAPLWAGIVSILNSYSLKRTNKTLGFLNPLLYKMSEECPKCFNDITLGDNKCPDASYCTSKCQGFQATRGWDPVTGLGSPNVEQMIKYINRLLKKKNYL